MKNRLLNLFLAMFCLWSEYSTAQVIDTTNYNPGIWHAFGDPSVSEQPKIRGRLSNFSWSDLETAPGVWDWTAFDSDLINRTKDGLPVIFMVFVRSPEKNAPDWLYSSGVPKVIIKDTEGNQIGSSPYYADPTYKSYFKKMVTTVHQHVETLPAAVRNNIIGVQACFGSTGDYIGYSGGIVPAQYDLTGSEFSALFREFTQYYYDEYKNTKPKINVMSNPASKGSDDALWLIQNCPGWLKNATLAKAFQLNDELDKAAWLYNMVNEPQAGNYVRMRCEIVGSTTSSGWWRKALYKNMFGVMCYDVYWGLDWSNEGGEQLRDPLYDSAFNFFNKYAGQKNPLQSTNALCALKDGLDASDSVRFPEAIYGTPSRTNTQRYQNIANKFSAFGAKLEDTGRAGANEMGQLDATGTNDVGWRIFPGNYDRYIHQITPNATSVGYWNVESADPSTMYGRFARGFDIANGKKGLYFDVDNAFLNNSPLNGQYPVIIEITYLDKGTGSWQLFYDGKDNSNKTSISVVCSNSGLWKKASVTLSDAYFGNKGNKRSDFYIKNTGSENVIFSVVELTRPKTNVSNVGLFASALSSFDTVCVNSTTAKSFSLTGAFLNNAAVTVGPLSGYTFSTAADGAYSDSLVISGYGTSFNKTVYVKLNPKTTGSYKGSIPVKGGSNIAPVKVNVIGISVNSSPVLSASVTNITCYGAKNGSINVTPAGGTGPFSYSWTNTGPFKSSAEDISDLVPDDYSVNITSVGGCTVSATYTVTQPAVLTVDLSDDSMICKGGTTKVYVTAAGGTAPYNGTGVFSVSAGSSSYTVTDAKGCTATKSIWVPNGKLVAPAKPSGIMGATADATGVCGNGNFNYSIAPVSNATSYAWTVPSQSSIASTNSDQTGITLSTTATFNGGVLSVSAMNVCGSSVAQTKTLSATPAKPGAISGPISVSSSQSGLKYSVPPVAGLTYTWTVPGAAKIISGQNTSAITVTWGGTSGYVKVVASNNCGTSPTSPLSVSVASSLAGAASNSSAAYMAIPDAKRTMVFPNPAKNVAYVSFDAREEHDYKIELTDLSGKLLQTKNGVASKGGNRVSIDVHNYANGIYLVTITNNKGERNTMKLVKE